MEKSLFNKLRSLPSHQVGKAIVWFVIILAIAYGYYRVTYKTVPERVYDVVQTGSLERCESFRDKIDNETNYYTVCRNNVLSARALDELDVSLC